MNCLKLKTKKVSILRQKRAPNDGLLMSQMNTGSGNSDTQMMICTNRLNCEDYCRKTSNGLLYNKSDMTFGSTVITDSHKLGIQLGRRNDCDKCGLIYSKCDDKYLNFASKFWGPEYNNMFISAKAKNKI